MVGRGRSSIGDPFSSAPLAAVVIAMPDEQAIILALTWLNLWLGKAPKPLDLILATLQGVPQVYNRDPAKPMNLKPTSGTQAKRALASLRARGWLRVSRDSVGGQACYDLCIPRMEFDDAIDLVIARLAPESVARLGGKIQSRSIKLAGRMPVYQANPAPAPKAQQGDLIPPDDAEKSKADKAAAVHQRAMLANELEKIWAELWGAKYEPPLRATGTTRGVFNFYAQEGVQPATFRAKVTAYLAQSDTWVTAAKHSLFALNTRWSQLGATAAPAAECKHPWADFKIAKDFGNNVQGHCGLCSKPMTRGKE